MAKNPTINLLHKVTNSTPIDQVLAWALSAGRWIVILTELVVIGAFIWRFSLDVKLTNLKEDIEEKKNIIRAFDSVEKEFRVVQKRVNSAASALAMQPDIKLIFSEFNRSFPKTEDLTINQLSWNADTISIKGEAIDEKTISIFENNLRSSSIVTNVSLNSVVLKVDEDQANESNLFEFSLSANIKAK